MNIYAGILRLKREEKEIMKLWKGKENGWLKPDDISKGLYGKAVKELGPDKRVFFLKLERLQEKRYLTKKSMLERDNEELFSQIKPESFTMLKDNAPEQYHTYYRPFGILSLTENEFLKAIYLLKKDGGHYPVIIMGETGFALYDFLNPDRFNITYRRPLAGIKDQKGNPKILDLREIEPNLNFNSTTAIVLSERINELRLVKKLVMNGPQHLDSNDLDESDEQYENTENALRFLVLRGYIYQNGNLTKKGKELRRKISCC